MISSKTVLSSVLPMLALVLSPLSAGAQTLVNYSFAGASGSQLSTSASTTAANLAASAITRGSGITANAGAGSINSNGWTTAASVDLNDYYDFSVTPDAGYEIDFSTLAFTESRSNTGIRNFEVRASTDNFATFTSLTTTAVPDNNLSRSQSINLTGFSSLQNQTNPVAFRLYGYSSEASGGTWRLSTALSVSGDITAVPTAIPEPSSLLGSTILIGLIAAKVRKGKN